MKNLFIFFSFVPLMLKSMERSQLDEVYEKDLRSKVADLVRQTCKPSKLSKGMYSCFRCRNIGLPHMIRSSGNFRRHLRRKHFNLYTCEICQKRMSYGAHQSVCVRRQSHRLKINPEILDLWQRIINTSRDEEYPVSSSELESKRAEARERELVLIEPNCPEMIKQGWYDEFSLQTDDASEDDGNRSELYDSSTTLRVISPDSASTEYWSFL